MEETIVKVDHLSHRYSVQWLFVISILKFPSMEYMDYSAPTEPGNPQR